MASIAATSIALLLILLSVPHLLGAFTAYQIGLFLIYGIAAQGIGFLWGRTGILPFGQAAFFGIAAYACAHILHASSSLPMQILLLIIVVVVLAAVAFLVAVAIFKGRVENGPFFSLITLAIAMVVEQVAGTATGLTGGFNGMGGYAPIGGLDPFGSLYYLIVAAVVASTTSLLYIDKLPAGLLARAVADNEKRLQLFGFPSHLIKGLAFGFSAALAGVAGILFANHQGIVTPTSTGFLLSANLVIWTAVGGRFHVLGPLIGAVGIGYLSSELRDSFAYWELLLAVLFIVVVLKKPGGISGLIASFRTRFLPSTPAHNSPQDTPPQTRTVQEPKALRFADARVKIGDIRILNGVTVTTPDKGIVCVIGPNGAGKTSLLNVITGSLPLTGGSVHLGKQAIQNRPPYKALNSGIARKLQVPSVFSTMTVEENLALAGLASRARFADFFALSALRWQAPQTRELLDTPHVPIRGVLHQLVSDLPQGHRQFLEFIMTAASQSPLLLLDEPCAGLSPDETKLMTALIEQYKAINGGLVVLIEHDMSIVRELSDHVIVLHQGAVLAQGTYENVSRDEQVRLVYAGGTK